MKTTGEICAIDYLETFNREPNEKDKKRRKEKWFSEEEIKKSLMKHLSATYEGTITIQPEYSKIVKDLFGDENENKNSR